LTVRVADLVAVPRVAVIFSALLVLTDEDVTVNVAEVAPAATVTLVGKPTDESPPDRVTVRPPVGAAPLRVTVPVLEVPPTTDVGETAKADRVGAATVSVPWAVDGPSVAVRLSLSFDDTTDEVTANVALDAPEAIETVEG
jgi:hypothetical protein